MYVRTHTYTYIWIHVNIYDCMYIDVYIYVHTYVYHCRYTWTKSQCAPTDIFIKSKIIYIYIQMQIHPYTWERAIEELCGRRGRRDTCAMHRFAIKEPYRVWLRLVGSIKLYVSFAKELYKRDDVLQKRPIIMCVSRTCARCIVLQ